MNRHVPGTERRSTMLRLWVLGPFRVERDGVRIPDAAWQRPTARTLLKLLATQPGHRLHQEQILELLWPELSPESALGSLRKATTLVRQALEPELPRRGASSFLQLVDGVLGLSQDTVWIDADQCETRAQEALRSRDEAAHREALALHGDELLPEDRYEDWTVERREGLARLQLQLLLSLADLLEGRGARTEAIEWLQQVLRQDPVREDVHRRVMRLQVASGNRHQALRHYQLCREVLERELGVEPEPETISLYEEISSGRLSPPPVPHPSRPGDAGPLPLAVRRLPQSPLVGRERPLQLLSSELSHLTDRRDADTRRGVLLIGGEAGVGKTRLALETARLAHDSGALVLRGGNYQQEGSAPYAPFVEALEGYLGSRSPAERESLASSYPELARLLPSLETGTAVSPQLSTNPAEEEAGRLRLFAAVVRFLAGLAYTHPVLLVLDDLHLADGVSLQLLHHLARVAPEQPWLIVGTYRDEDIEAGSAFQRLRTSLTRVSLVRHLDLLRLSRGDCATLVASLLPGGTPDDTLLDRLYALSLGNALFAQELVQSMQEVGLTLHDGRWMNPAADISIPPQVRDLIMERMSRLAEPTRQILMLAAVAGMESDYVVLRMASTLDESTLLDALDGALSAHILEARDTGFVFRHPLLRETLYEGLSRARRSHLHGILAAALEQHRSEEAEALAYHYARADAPEAAAWLERAGDRAAAVYATDAALAHYEDARRRLEGRDACGQARLDEKLGQVLLAAGRYDEALDVLERAAGAKRDAGDQEAMGRVTAGIGLAHRWRGTPEEGIARVQPALALLARGAPSQALAMLHLALAHLFLLAGRYEEMLETARRAGEIAGAMGEHGLLAESAERQGAALLLLHRPEEGQRVIEGAIPLIEAGGNLDLLRRALQNAGCAAAYLGQLERQCHYFERALALAERVGNPDQIAFVLGNLGNALTSLGDWEGARRHLDRAVELTRAGGRKANRAAPTTMRGILTIREGRWEQAAGWLQQSLALAEETSNRQAWEQAQGSLAELDLLQGRIWEAIARLEPQAARDDADVVLLALLAWAQLDAGDRTRAETLARTAVARARAEEPLNLPDALRVQGMVLARQGRMEEASQSLAESLDLARAMPVPYVEACVLSDLGVLASRLGRIREGRSRLEDALAIFRRLGARKDVERTEQALAEVAAI